MFTRCIVSLSEQRKLYLVAFNSFHAQGTDDVDGKRSSDWLLLARQNSKLRSNQSDTM